jgi:hypothetical protein
VAGIIQGLISVSLILLSHTEAVPTRIGV